MRIGAEFGSLGLQIEKELKAYRIIVAEERTHYDAGFPITMGGPFSWGVRYNGRVGSEIVGVIRYCYKRFRKGYSPEEILLSSHKEIDVWKRMRQSSSYID